MTRYDWPVDGGPACNYASSVDIGVRRVVAQRAPKLVLGFTVLFGCVAAFGALPTGIARVDCDQRYASESGLVRDEQKQLRERPGMQNGTLLLPGLDPIADSLEVFNGYSALGAFSFGNDLFTLML